MACNIASGIVRDCKNSIGGLRNIYLFDYVDDAFTVSAGQATAINPLVTAAYEFEIDGDGHTLVEDFVPSRDNGTSVNTQTLTAMLKKIDATKSATLNTLVYGRTIAVVRDRNDVYSVMGIYDGCDFSVNSATGSAKADMNGYTLTGTATTNALAPKLDSATITAFLALVA